MANATVGTVNALVANGQIADPSGDSLNTGTVAVTLKYDTKGETNRVIFRVTNGGAHTATFSVAAGNYPPAMRSGIGAFTSNPIPATNGVAWFGPFESGQFAGSDDTLSVTFTPSGGDTITGAITCFQLPKGV